MKDKFHGRTVEYRDDAVGQSPQEAIKKIDKDKVKRKKSRGDISRKKDLMDDDISLKGNWKMVLNWLPTARRSSKRRGKAGPKLQEMLKKGSWLHLLMLMLDMDIDHQCQVIARERRGAHLKDHCWRESSVTIMFLCPTNHKPPMHFRKIGTGWADLVIQKGSKKARAGKSCVKGMCLCLMEEQCQHGLYF